jgi:pimeloyl-ACP methyl ester carboxylesterase
LRNTILALLLTFASRFLLYRDRLNGTLKRFLHDRSPDAERWAIPSGGRKLSGIYLSAGEAAPVLLICHGIGERVEYWGGVQTLLRNLGASSLVFNYSGYGESSGTISCTHCEQDAIAACRMLSERGDQPIFLLGFSLGTGVASAVAARLPLEGVILCEGFSTLREAGVAFGFPRWVTRIVPDAWRTVDRVSEIEVPILIMHSSADSLFPAPIAQQVALASGKRGTLILLDGLEHNAPIFTPTDFYWRPVVDWINQTLSQPAVQPPEASPEIANPR